ncbi:MAG: hypothetical protein ACE15E_16320 [Acidobacteriota bacterium]
MRLKGLTYVVTVLSLLVPGELFPEKPADWSRRLLVYRQDNGPAYCVTQTRDQNRLSIAYQYGNQNHQVSEVRCIRDLKTGRLQSCEIFSQGGSRRYEFSEKHVQVTRPGGGFSTHRLTTAAHPQLLDAVCAFVAGGRDFQEVSYISQAESFATQGFVMTHEGRQIITTPAGTFECSKVKLTLDSRLGALFFRLDFLVAEDSRYPYIVKGRTSRGGDFQLVAIDRQEEK